MTDKIFNDDPDAILKLTAKLENLITEKNILEKIKA